MKKIVFITGFLIACASIFVSCRNNLNESNIVHKNDYISAENFIVWNTDKTFDVEETLITKYNSRQVDVTGSTKYNLNINITVTKGYKIMWYTDSNYSIAIETQEEYLKYGDNIFFANIVNEKEQFICAYAINIYVLHDYKYTFYECQPNYALENQMDIYKEIVVTEDDYISPPESPNNGYRFKSWVTYQSSTDQYQTFNFDAPAESDLTFYATYEDEILDFRVDGLRNVVFKPYLTSELEIPTSQDGNLFIGYCHNGVKYFDKDGHATEPLPYSAIKGLNIEYSDSAINPELYFEFTAVRDGYSIKLKNLPSYGIVQIPSTYKEKKVVEIEDNAFSGCSSLTSIIIPNSVTRIGDGAFSFCNSLTSISIPNSVTSIGMNAFYECSSLKYNEYENCLYLGNEENPFLVLVKAKDASKTKVTISNNAKCILNMAFYKCGFLTSVVIPNSVTCIGSSAFYNCSFLKSITLPFVGETLNGTSNTHFGYIFGASTSSDNSKYVPSRLKEVIITGGANIGSSAFQNCSSLTTISIPNSVTSIGDSAFSRCSSLTSISIPNGVTSIGQGAFSECSSLNSIILPFVGSTLNGTSNTHLGYIFGADSCDDNSKYVPTSLKDVIITGGTTIGSFAFQNCSSLTTISIPNSVTSIGGSAFSRCSSLTSISIPNGVTSIGNNAFYNCSSITSVTFKENSKLTSIGSSAFENCNFLTSIVIPKGVTSIGNLAFYNCSSLTSVTFEENSKLTSIGSSAFENCNFLTSIVIPNDVTSIGESAFSGCKSLLSVVISNSVISIEDDAFSRCSYLTSIIIPNSVTSIGNLAFYNCSSLTSVTFEENSKLTSIGESAFSSCRSLTSISIPNSVTSIGESAFSGCKSLLSVVISNNATSIGESAFYNCSFLESITIPFVGATLNGTSNAHFGYIFGASSYNDNSSYVPSRLKEVIITGGTIIGSSAFYNCSSLTSITIPNIVTSIGYGAFSNCSSLQYNEYENCLYLGNKENPYLVLVKAKDTSITKATISNNTKVIMNGAFRDCSSLTTISIPNSVTSIGGSAFSRCSSLTSIIIPTSVTSIGFNAFYNCSSITSVTFEENSKLTSIGNYAFDDCSSLTSIVIPNSVTSIGNYAFDDCSSLASVTFEKNSMLTSVGEFAFSECSSLVSIVIPNNVTYIGEYAFHYCSFLIIYCESGVQSNGWAWNWNRDYDWRYPGDRPVYWEINENNYLEQDGVIYVVRNGNAIVTGHKANITDVVIPSTITINGTEYNVTRIVRKVFYNCSSITSIVIPNSVTSIGDSAFCGCISLESITLPFVGATLNGTDNTHFGHIFGAPTYSDNSSYVPTSLKEVIITGGISISGYAFSNCSSLTSIVIPKSVTSIGEYAFLGCDSLKYNEYGNCLYLGNKDNPYLVLLRSKNTTITEAIINDNTRFIMNNAFYGDSLASIVIQNSVISIGEGAFYNCRSLTSIVIPNSVTSIGEDAFRGCRFLTSVYFNGTIEDWCKINFETDESNPMYYASHFYLLNENNEYEEVTEVIIPDTITSIGKYQFCGFNKVTNITITTSVTSIGYQAFYNCSSLTSIVIPNSVTSIGSWAFENCSSLTSIVIPNSVTSIGGSVFYKCSSLTIYCEASSKPSGWSSYWNSSDRPVFWGINENDIINQNNLQF